MTRGRFEEKKNSGAGIREQRSDGRVWGVEQRANKTTSLPGISPACKVGI